MNKRIYFIILLLTCSICNAQNLVPNNGFENLTGCPTAQNQLNMAPPWQMPANTSGASSDLFVECNTNGFGVPVNPAGYQYAHTDTSYAGFYTYGAGDLREYVQVQLVSPLIAGTLYKAEMWVSPAEMAGIAIDAIGIYFSAGPVSGTGNALNLPFMPQVSNPVNNIITDTAGWTLVSGFYTATGGENYITIGNFTNDAGTNTVTFNSSGWGRGYYWVDDISVSNATTINEPVGQAAFTVSPNPFSDKLNVMISEKDVSEFILYDILPGKIMQQKFTNTVSLNTEQLAKGLYVYEVRNKNGVIKKGKIVKY